MTNLLRLPDHRFFLMIPTDWPLAEHSHLHHVRGIDWHVQRTGQPPHAAPTLLMLHGTGGSTHGWADCVPALAPHFHIMVPDLPGHGFTRVPPHVERATNPFALTGMARLLGQLLDHLDVRPDIVVGHSAGVPLLLRMTLDGSIAPQRIVGVCPALVPPPSWYVTFVAPLLGQLLETDTVAGATARLAAGTSLVHQLLSSTGTRLTKAQADRYTRLCSNPAHVHAAITMMARWDLPALFRDVGLLRTPVQLIAARDDRWIPLAPLRRAVERLPHTTLAVEDGGHLLPEERPEVVVRAITAGLHWNTTS